MNRTNRHEKTALRPTENGSRARLSAMRGRHEASSPAGDPLDLALLPLVGPIRVANRRWCRSRNNRAMRLGSVALLVAALLGMAGFMYGIAFAATNVFGGDELGEPCSFGPHDREGSTLGTRARYWPPGVKCIHAYRGDVTKIEVHEWSWIPFAVYGCAAAAVVVLGAGVVRATRDARTRMRSPGFPG
jgi:hypothetical protein